jgi:NSS family neurotransmitter:Na+ symporter
MHPVVGYILAVVFYLTLSIAAISSAISLLEMGLVAAREATGISRNKALAILAPLLLVAGLPSALSYSGVKLSVAGKAIFDLLDSTIGDYGLPAGVLLTALVIGWLLPWRSLQQAVGGGFVGWSCLTLVRLVVPVVILAALLQCVITGC